MNNVAMHDPLLVEMLITMYFKMNDPKKEDAEVMTVPGFALHIGFSCTRDIVETLKSYEEGTCQYPEDSIRFLQRALTKLEDYYLQNGMKNNFPTQLVKFCLGAYHQVKEAADPQQVAGNANIMVVFNDAQAPQLPNQQAKLANAAAPVIEFNAQ